MASDRPRARTRDPRRDGRADPQPRIAIGIPTRNRVDLASAAVRSIAGVTGVEVVVSDNSTDPAQAERLEALCAALGVEYVRQEEPLAMTAHWERLLAAMRERLDPTHVGYLTDRMVFTSAGLHAATRVVADNPDRIVSYRHDRLEDAEPPIELVQSQWTGRVLELDAVKLIEMSSRAAYGDHLPRMLNSVTPVAVVDAIAARFGSIFTSASPDYSFAFRALAVCDSILHLDRACLIHYGMDQSSGISYLRGKPNEHAAYFERMLDEHRFAATPEPGFETIANAVFQEYCHVRAEVGDGRFPPVSAPDYVTANWISTGRIEDPEWRARLLPLLARHGWGPRLRARHALRQFTAMGGYFLRHPTAFLRSVRRQFWERPPGTPIAGLSARAGIDPRTRDTLRFTSAAEAIAHAEAHPRRRTAYAWHVHQLEQAGAVRRSWEGPAMDGGHVTGRQHRHADSQDRSLPSFLRG